MFYNIKSSSIFNVLAVLILIITLFLYYDFTNTKENIINTYDNSTKKYVQNFVQNLKISILKETNSNIYSTLSSDREIVDILQKHLCLFITDRYKSIYLLGRDSNSSDYIFLLDGSKDLENKSEFGEIYKPLNSKQLQSVYSAKESIFFLEKKVEGLWMTYLSPIVIDSKVEALLVVDFSVEDFNSINRSLDSFSDIYGLSVLFLLVVFSIIILFSYLDIKREREKERAFLKLEQKSIALKNESSKVNHLNHTLEDRVEEEVSKNRQKDQQMLQQSRLAQMGEMISMIAHQWRQPLAAISSTSSSLELKAYLGKLDKEIIIEQTQNISKYSQHLSSTIDDFRDFFKEEKEKREISYTEIIESIFGIIKVSIENKNITLVEDFSTDRRFNTHPNELKQVIMNLIKNAEDILIEKEIESPYIKIITYSNGDEEILEIEDNGGGVPDSIIEKIFDPYFSTKLEKNGTGLGLYMSKTIIHEHCGGILSVSNSENGAVFKIVLNGKN